VVLPLDMSRAGARPERLAVFTATRGSTSWTRLETTVDLVAGTARASVMHFSLFVVGLTGDSPLDAGAERSPPPVDAAAEARPVDAAADTLDAPQASDSPSSDGGPARTDTGSPDTLPPDSAAPPIAIPPAEVATRLARFFWKAAPDAALLARTAELSSYEGVRRLGQEMFRDPRAGELPADFVVWWLVLDRLSAVDLDTAIFPSWSDDLRAAMLAETRAFATHFGGAGDGRLATLLTASESFVNALLAKQYGIAGVTSPQLVRVVLDPRQRAGLLTQGAVLAATSWPYDTSPTRRGLLVRERLLCQDLPPHPASVSATPPPRSNTLTRREQYENLVADPACQGCHRLVDVPGFAFENYDPTGAYRTTSAGKPIDASGSLITDTGDLPFINAVELTTRLAISPDVRRCFAVRWLEYALGRRTDGRDTASLERLFTSGAASDWSISALAPEAAASPSFLAR
jgi:hypothetical protein